MKKIRRNQLTKFFTVLLSLAMIMSIMPFAVSAAETASGKCGKNVDWTLDSKGTLTISGTGDMNDFYIPSPWNSHKDNISKVVILPGVTNIGMAAFMNCDKITDVTIPASVTTIKMSAFSGCTFKTITIPNSVTTIASTAFSMKDKFNIILEEGNKTYHIDGNCLIETDSKRLVLGFEDSTIPDDGSVTIIGDNAFAECRNLERIELPDCITTVEYGAFSSCENLKDIVIPTSVTNIGDNAFFNCSSLESVVIPNKVKGISGYLFMKCTNLKNIVMPNGITSIGSHAFSDCVSLRDINLPDSVTNIGEYAYSGCTSISDITLPNCVVSVGKCLFEGCTGLEKVVFPENLKSVGKCMFVGCTKIKSITVDEKNSKYHSSGNCLIETKSKVLVLGCCNSTIPDDGSVKVIASNSFQGCIGLESIAIPEGVETIKSFAFDNCKDLTDVTIAESVKWIETYAFDNCDSLKIVHYRGTEEQWGHINVGLNNTYLESSKIICSDTPEYQNPFIDIHETEYFYDPVQWAVERKITNGTTSTTFSPYEVCTRAQLVTFLWRSVGSPTRHVDFNPYYDVFEDDYYYDAVMWATDLGITFGTSSQIFSPDEPCTRAQAVTFLWRYRNSEQIDIDNPFVDVPNDEYYTAAVLWAVENEITDGTSKTTFEPDTACTRAHIVTFLYRNRVK